MFKKIKFGSRDSIGYENLDLPTRELETTSLWIVPPQSSLALCRKWGRVPSEGLKGIVNVLTEVIPFFVMGDTTDIGGVVDSANLGTPALFIYDKYPGGIGFAEKAFDWVEQIMTAALELISECPCRDGCPSCVGAALPMSAKDGPHERDLVPDKDAALVLLHDMLEREPYQPKERRPPVLDEATPSAGPGKAPSPPVKPLPPNVEAKIRSRVQDMRGTREGRKKQ
jgi:DEAD/DEAH box helicase domain-containing protein